MIVYDHHGQPQTEISAVPRTILHPSDTKYLTCFLLQKQSRRAEEIGKENAAEVLLVSSLTTAVVFSGLPYIVLTTAVKYLLGRPPVASRVCNHTTDVLRSYESLPPLFAQHDKLGCYHCSSVSAPALPQDTKSVSPEQGSTYGTPNK